MAAGDGTGNGSTEPDGGHATGRPRGARVRPAASSVLVQVFCSQSEPGGNGTDGWLSYREHRRLTVTGRGRDGG